MGFALADRCGQLHRLNDARGNGLEEHVVEDILSGPVGEGHLGRGGERHSLNLWP